MSHFYDHEGKPQYEVFKVGGKEKRPSTLADARKHHWVPSVTTVSGILAKPQLNKWIIDQTLDTVIDTRYEVQKLDCDNIQAIKTYKAQISAITKDKTDVAANRGTEIHDKLEQYFLTGLIDSTDEHILVPALNMLAHEFNGQRWIPEASFAHLSGFGGKVDLYSKSGIIIDFKTKAKDEVNEKSVYDDYCIQLAAYRLGLDIPKAKCYNLIISTTKPGTLYLHRWTEEDLIDGLEKFNLMLALWKRLNNFDSGWEVE